MWWRALPWLCERRRSLPVSGKLGEQDCSLLSTGHSWVDTVKPCTFKAVWMANSLQTIEEELTGDAEKLDILVAQYKKNPEFFSTPANFGALPTLCLQPGLTTISALPAQNGKNPRPCGCRAMAGFGKIKPTSRTLSSAEHLPHYCENLTSVVR